MLIHPLQRTTLFFIFGPCRLFGQHCVLSHHGKIWIVSYHRLQCMLIIVVLRHLRLRLFQSQMRWVVLFVFESSGGICSLKIGGQSSSFSHDFAKRLLNGRILELLLVFARNQKPIRISWHNLDTLAHMRIDKSCFDNAYLTPVNVLIWCQQTLDKLVKGKFFDVVARIVFVY